MKKLNVTNQFNFIVAINQTNNNKALLPYILYKKMELYGDTTALPFKDYICSKPSLLKLNILKNAFLNDQLYLQSQIKKLSSNELQLIIEVVKKKENKDDVICNATFYFSLNNYEASIAS